ncbi:MAG TPA: MBL fold metallo-hydrolase [Solirubrobacteraceae bacterium]|jgi:glyoxylase-like metal-dependent hydrolase (beta-lactamase superfamily II)|nr:MBL fold metallo-hydrolase [Solirubrobacteraceae bacterium]
MSIDLNHEPEVEHDQRPPTVLGASALVEVAPDVWILPDRDRVPHVPNIGIVVGSRSALIVESGTGIANGRRVLDIVRQKWGDRRLFATATHFHPEHGYGVQALVDVATIIYNEAQRDELKEKQDIFTRRFSGFTAHLAEALRGAEYVPPDIVYSDRAEIDLGGRVVQLHHFGPAHTRGDQVVFLPEEKVLFAGDLVEERFFCIMPDSDTRPSRWVSQLERMRDWNPKVVVPGHGALGGPEEIDVVLTSLVYIRDTVREMHATGAPLEVITARIEPETLARYPDWGNRDWVGRIVAQFHVELLAGSYL